MGAESVLSSKVKIGAGASLEGAARRTGTF